MRCPGSACYEQTGGMILVAWASQLRIGRATVLARDNLAEASSPMKLIVVVKKKRYKLIIKLLEILHLYSKKLDEGEI